MDSSEGHTGVVNGEGKEGQSPGDNDRSSARPALALRPTDPVHLGWGTCPWTGQNAPPGQQARASCTWGPGPHTHWPPGKGLHWTVVTEQMAVAGSSPALSVLKPLLSLAFGGLLVGSGVTRAQGACRELLSDPRVRDLASGAAGQSLQPFSHPFSDRDPQDIQDHRGRM